MRRRAPQRIDQITPGFYRTTLVRNGYPVGAEITLTDGIIGISQDGETLAETFALADLPEIIIEATMEGSAFRHPLLRIIWFGTRIEAAEHAHLLREARWARANNPRHPAANPTKPVDMNDIPIKDIF
jgi:hypothetical protein